MDICPSCGVELIGRTLSQSLPGEHPRLRRRPTQALRRCPSCRRLAVRAEGLSETWTDGGIDPSLDYMFDWEPRPLHEPWTLIATTDAKAILEAELRAEVTEGHPLFDKHVIAIARCGRCDEVVFSVEDYPARFVQVHLTWKQGPEREQDPWTEDLTLPLSTSLADHSHRGS